MGTSSKLLASCRLLIGSLLLVARLASAGSGIGGKYNAIVSPAAWTTCDASGDPHMYTFDNVYYHPQGRCSYVLAQAPCYDGQPANTELFKIIDSWKPWGNWPGRTVSMAITVELRNPDNPAGSPPFRIRMGTREGCNANNLCADKNLLWVDPNMSNKWVQYTNYTWTAGNADTIYLPSSWSAGTNFAKGTVRIRLGSNGQQMVIDASEVYGFYVRLRSAQDGQKRGDGGNWYDIGVDKARTGYTGKTCGLCGNMNGVTTDDFQLMTNAVVDNKVVYRLSASIYDSSRYADFNTAARCVDNDPSTFDAATLTHCQWLSFINTWSYPVSGAPATGFITSTAGNTAVSDWEAVATNQATADQSRQTWNAALKAGDNWCSKSYAFIRNTCDLNPSMRDTVIAKCTEWIRDPAWSACTRFTDVDAMVNGCVADSCVCSESELRSTVKASDPLQPCDPLRAFYNHVLQQKCSLPGCTDSVTSKVFCDRDGLDTRTIGCAADQRIKIIGAARNRGIDNNPACQQNPLNFGDVITRQVAERCNGRSFCDINIEDAVPSNKDNLYNWLKVSFQCECPAMCPMNAKTSSKRDDGTIRCVCNDGYVPIYSSGDSLLRCDPATCSVPSETEAPEMVFDDCQNKTLGQTCFVGCEPPYTLRSSASATVSGRATRVPITCERGAGPMAAFKLPQCVDDVFMARSGGIPTQVLFDERWCLEDGMAYNVPATSVIQTASKAMVGECQDLCRDTLECTRFVYDRTPGVANNCKLIPSAHGGPIANSAVTSGPRVCPAPVADGWCFQWGFSIKGAEPEEANGGLPGVRAQKDTALACQQMCAGNPKCKAFQWAVADKMCTLRTSMNNIDVTPAGTATSVVGPASCPYRPNSKWCFESGLGYQQDTAALVVPSVDKPFKCQMLCSADPSCRFFTWKAGPKECVFHRQNAASLIVPETVPNPQGFRGPRFCPTASYCLENHVSFVKAGTHTVVATLSNVRSADKCQIECQGNTGCRFFTWNAADRTCTLLKNPSKPNLMQPALDSRSRVNSAVSGPQGCHALGGWCSYRGYTYTAPNLELAVNGTLTGIASAVLCMKECQTNLRCNFWAWNRADNTCKLFAGNLANYPAPSATATDVPLLTEAESWTAGPRSCRLPTDYQSQPAVAYRAWLQTNGNIAQSATGEDQNQAHAIMNTPWNRKRGSALSGMTVSLFANVVAKANGQTLFEIGSGGAYIRLQTLDDNRIQLALKAGSTATVFSVQTDSPAPVGSWFMAAFTVAYGQACLYVVHNYKLVGGDYYCVSVGKDAGAPFPQGVFDLDPATSHILVGASTNGGACPSDYKVKYSADGASAAKDINVCNVIQGAIREVQVWDRQLLPSVILDLQHHRVARTRMGCIQSGLQSPDANLQATQIALAANAEECQKLCQESPSCNYFNFNVDTLACSSLAYPAANTAPSQNNRLPATLFRSGPAFCRGTLPTGDWSQIPAKTSVPLNYNNGPWHRGQVAGMGATPDANGWRFLTEGFSFFVGYRSPASGYTDTLLDLVGATSGSLLNRVTLSAAPKTGSTSIGTLSFRVWANAANAEQVSLDFSSGSTLVVAVTLGRGSQCLWLVQRSESDPIRRTCVANAALIGDIVTSDSTNTDGRRFIGKAVGSSTNMDGSMVRAKMYARVVNPTEIAQFAEDALASMEAKGLVGTLGAEDSKSFAIIDLSGSWVSTNQQGGTSTFTVARECSASDKIVFNKLNGNKAVDARYTLSASGLTIEGNSDRRGVVKYFASLDERGSTKVIWYNKDVVEELWTLDISKGIPEMNSCPVSTSASALLKFA